MERSGGWEGMGSRLVIFVLESGMGGRKKDCRI